MKNELFIYNYYPLEFMGGGEQIAITLFNALSSDYGISYFSPDDSMLVARLDISSIRNSIGFRYSRCKYLDYSMLRNRVLYKSFPAKDEIADKNFICIFISSPVPAKFLKYLSRQKKKVLFLVHGLTVESKDFSSISSIKISIFQTWIKLNFFMNRKLYRSQTFFYQILNTPQQNMLLKSGVGLDHISLIYNGIDFSKYRVGMSNDKFRIVFIGRIEKLIKGVDFLLKIAKEIFRLNPDIEIQILGSGKDQDMISDASKHWQQLKYLGYVTPEQKLKVLEESSLMIVTSRIEPFPLTIIEGLASGLPVVSSDSSGPKHIIGLDNLFGRTTSLDVPKFISCIFEYFSSWDSDNEKFHVHKQERRLKAEKIFNHAKMIEEYKDTIDRIISGE